LICEYLKWSVHGLRQNNPTGKFSLKPSGKSPLKIRPSHLAKGRIAIVTNAGWDAVAADAPLTNGVWTRRRVVLTPQGWRQVRAKERGRR
jgi:hypothetical protein